MTLWIWRVSLALGLISLLASLKYAYGKGLFGGELGDVIDAFLWAFAVAGALASFLGILGTFKEASRSLAITLVNRVASRIIIVVLCFGLSAFFFFKARGVAPPPLWTCEITGESVPRKAVEGLCPSNSKFDRTQTFVLRLSRAGELGPPARLLARTNDRAARSVDLDSTRGGGCRSSGPDSPRIGESQLELVPECAAAGAYEVRLHLCYRQGPTTEVSAAELHEVAELTLIEGENARGLRCENRTGGTTGTRIDAGVEAGIPDASPPDAGSPGGNTSAVCPPWTRPAGSNQSWLFASVRSSDGRPLTPAGSNLDVLVRSIEPPGPERRAEPNDPCAVANYASTTVSMLIGANAPGFSSQERSFVPAQCTRTEPCALVLPRTLSTVYYSRDAHNDRLLAAEELPPGISRASFAADVAQDAIERSRASKRPLETELALSSRASGVPMNDLLAQFADRQLGRHCDAQCGDNPRLDGDVRLLLRELRQKGVNPFRSRSPIDAWRRPVRPPR